MHIIHQQKQNKNPQKPIWLQIKFLCRKLYFFDSRGKTTRSQTPTTHLPK